MKPDDSGEPTRFFFVHLQKTGGTALFRRMRNHFGRQAVYPMPEYQGSPETALGVDLLCARFAAHRDEIRVVTGHFPLCVTELLGVPFTTFTVLRDPVERALSFLRHQRKEEPRFAEASLADIYADPVCRDGLIRNHMVRMLSLTTEEMTEGALTPVIVDEARLERAKANLEERVDVVGWQENFDEFCEELTSRFGWDLGEPQFANRTSPSEVDDELARRIAKDNEVDAAFYRFSRDLRARRRRRATRGSGSAH